MLDQIMKLAGMNQVTPDMMPGADNVPVMKADDSCGCGGDAEYDNAPNEQYSEVDAVTTNAGIEGVNGKKAPQDIRVKDPSPYEDFEVGRLQDLAGIESDDEVEEEWDNEPDELYKDYDGDEYANNAGGATRKTRQVPARSGDNPLEGLEDHLRQAYEEFMAERELSKPEAKEKERIFKGMKKAKGDFKKRYGDRGEEVMHATATKMAKKRA
jgi:hypothetical protein